MEEGFALWANPSSPHAEGRKARAALEEARERIKAALGWDGELIFTSGASEALGIGLGRAKAERRIVSAVEHDAVFRAAPDAEVVQVVDGRVDREQLAQALTGSERAVIAVQQVNSETGTVQPVDELSAQVREVGGILVSDCSQSAGKFPLPDADMIVVSAHKLGGPVGIGALLVKDFALLEPSGGQERGYRMGTENLPAALGFAAALEVCAIEKWRTTVEQQCDFRDELWRHGKVIAPGPVCHPIIAVASERFSANAMLVRLDAMGFAVSAGSACSSGSLKPSRVLKAFGIDDATASRTIRVSIGWNTTPEELDAFADAWAKINTEVVTA